MYKKMYIEEGKISYQYYLGNGQFLMEVFSPQVAGRALPGQFVHIACGPALSTDPLLRRPISIHRINKEQGSIEIYYLVVGKGTELLGMKSAGDNISIMGPLGRGFALEQKAKKAVLVGGGMGIAPLLALAQELAKEGKEVVSVLGAASGAGLARAGAFLAYGKLIEATEDGSRGLKGRVTDHLEASILGNDTLVYACGPLAMLRAVAEMTGKMGVPCQVSLEARMACGVGACLGCTCVSTAEGAYPKVCKDGPVFWTSEVSL